MYLKKRLQRLSESSIQILPTPARHLNRFLVRMSDDRRRGCSIEVGVHERKGLQYLKKY